MLCTVYGDLLFLTEFLMDFVLLSAVMTFGGFHGKLRNLLIGALCGGGYGLISVLPAGLFLRSWYWKIGCSLLLVKIGFPQLKGKQYLIALLYFYFIGFAMAGAVIFLSRFFGDVSPWGGDLAYTSLTLCGALLPVLLIFLWREKCCAKTVYANQLTVPVAVFYDGKKAELSALFDTGNELVDPVTKRPVMVVECSALNSLLPPYLREILADESRSPDRIFAELQSYPIATRLRLIPYASLGQSHGMMLGMRPDKICFTCPGKKELTQAVIGFYRGTLHTKENCRCIVNPILLESE